jgi:biopolymer transport protein ExbD
MTIRIAPIRRGRRAESLLPMIDVVFFLIIFFMMVSHFAAPEPFAVARPTSDGTEAVAGELSLFLDAAGQWGHVGPDGAVMGDAALQSLQAALQDRCAVVDCTETPAILLLHADAEAPASLLAEALPKLLAMGFADLRLITVGE